MPFTSGFNLTVHMDDLSKKYVRKALLSTGENLKKTASILGISYRSLRYLIDKYGLKTLSEEEQGENQKNTRSEYKAVS